MDLFRTLRYARRYANWREMLRHQARGENPPRVCLRRGPRFEAPPSVNAARAINGIFFKRCYTPAGFEIRNDDVVVDVGANIGVFSVFAATRSRGRILAIEPHPENVGYLTRNLRSVGAANAAVVPVAAADRPGPVRLFVGRKGVTHQIFSHDEQGAIERSVEVQAQPLAEILETHGLERVDFLKLDCEGAEGLILPALPTALFRRIGRIALEFHDYASPLSHEELGKLLTGHGYRVQCRWNGRSSTGFLYATR